MWKEIKDDTHHSMHSNVQLLKAGSERGVYYGDIYIYSRHTYPERLEVFIGKDTPTGSLQQVKSYLVFHLLIEERGSSLVTQLFKHLGKVHLTLQVKLKKDIKAW